MEFLVTGRTPPDGRLPKSAWMAVWFRSDVEEARRKALIRNKPVALRQAWWGPRHLELTSAGDVFDSEIAGAGGLAAFHASLDAFLEKLHGQQAVLFVLGCWHDAEDEASVRDRRALLGVATPELEASLKQHAGQPGVLRVVTEVVRVVQQDSWSKEDPLLKRMLTLLATTESDVLSELVAGRSEAEVEQLMHVLPALAQLTLYSDAASGIPRLLALAEPRATLERLLQAADSAESVGVASAIANNLGLVRDREHPERPLRLALEVYGLAERQGALSPHDVGVRKKYQQKLERLAKR